MVVYAGIPNFDCNCSIYLCSVFCLFNHLFEIRLCNVASKIIYDFSTLNFVMYWFNFAFIDLHACICHFLDFDPSFFNITALAIGYTIALMHRIIIMSTRTKKATYVTLYDPIHFRNTPQPQTFRLT